MADVHAIATYADALLEAARFNDYCPNGLQVEGRAEVTKVVCGVTASLAFIEAAAAEGGDLLLVHHGYFWKGEAPVITGMKRRRLQTLFADDLNLLAYHLPLDAHPALGNNAQLAQVLGLQVEGRFGPADIAAYGRLPVPMGGEDLAALIEARLGRTPLHISGGGKPLRRVAWCTGGAQGYFEDAVALGVDAYITGEASEQSYHVAKECGVHFFAAGHHATERYGVQALGRHLAGKFGLEYAFVDVENPI